jgi:hypothetical protein
MDESIKMYFENKCKPIKEEFGFDIFKNIESSLDKLIEQNGLVSVFLSIETSIQIAYDMIKYGAKINKKGKTIEEIFFPPNKKNKRTVKI